MDIPIQKLYLGGRHCDALSGETFPTYCPSSGLKITEVQIAGEKDVEAAVQSSIEGFQVWSKFTSSQRARVLLRAAQILRDRTKELAHLEVLDTGKPISEAISVDLPSSAEALEFFAAVSQAQSGQHIDLGKSFAYTRKEPLGVCLGIGAWNYPLQIACWKSAPALACGNSMIFKPSELSPLTATKLAEIYTEAGLPPGVFNVVQGAGRTGELLVQHPGIQKVSLTGSVGTGKKVMALASETLKKVTLELGGKSPLILFSDCNLDQAVSTALLANFFTQGEICSNGTRVFVQESIYNEFVEKIVNQTKQIQVGDPLNPSTQMGALISRSHLDKVLNYVRTAEKQGAVVAFGGREIDWGPSDGHLKGGNFMEPTVLVECQDEMTHVREEIFGPVMSVLQFKSEEEVVHRANETQFGLAAGVFTMDIQRAHRVVAQLQAGVCWINNYNITPLEMPFGGYKQSGLGRENGLMVLDHYTQTKSVYVEMG